MAKATLTIDRVTAEVILGLCEDHIEACLLAKTKVPDSIETLIHRIEFAFPMLSSEEYDFRDKRRKEDE